VKNPSRDLVHIGISEGYGEPKWISGTAETFAALGLYLEEAGWEPVSEDKKDVPTSSMRPHLPLVKWRCEFCSKEEEGPVGTLPQGWTWTEVKGGTPPKVPHCSQKCADGVVESVDQLPSKDKPAAGIEQDPLLALLTPTQLANFEALRWLVHPELRAHGRTTALAVAFIDWADLHVGQAIRFWDHYPQTHSKHLHHFASTLWSLIDKLKEHPKWAKKEFFIDMSQNTLTRVK
jgi:hypothetical protein